MNVLSLFDGMSCGQLALQRAGITYDNYYASEIDKYAIKVTQANFPDTIQLGDIREIKGSDLPQIDLLIGGSPCQGFSFAGKQLNFDDPRSQLFFEYVRLLKEVKPRYFLLENVRMKKESQDVISVALGIEPIMIDSALVSAQSRKRLYWTNIPNVTQPEDKGIYVKDIISKTILSKDVYKIKDADGLMRIDKLSKYFRHNAPKYRNIPTLLSELCDTPSGRSRQSDRLYSMFSKSPSLLSNFKINIHFGFDENNDNWYTLSLLDRERLQTLPDNYTCCVSDNQRYSMLGNGWTVDVIAHIFKGLHNGD